MSRRLALENPSINVCLPNALIFSSSALLLGPEPRRGAQRSTRNPFAINNFRTLFYPERIRGGRATEGAFLRHLLSPSAQDKSLRMRIYEQTPRFAWFWPKLSSRNSFRIRTCKNSACNSFRMRIYEKRWGEGSRALLYSIASDPVANRHARDADYRSPRQLASFFSSTYNLKLRTKYFSL
jgi:hypothetical protein